MGITHASSDRKADFCRRLCCDEARGIIPVFFLGLAITFAAAYTAYVTREPPEQLRPGSGVYYKAQMNRLADFMEWGLHPIYRRRYFLHVAVFSLGAGVIFLPIPYLDFSGVHFSLFGFPTDASIAGLALLLVFTIPGILDLFVEGKVAAGWDKLWIRGVTRLFFWRAH